MPDKVKQVFVNGIHGIADNTGKTSDHGELNIVVVELSITCRNSPDFTPPVVEYLRITCRNSTTIAHKLSSLSLLWIFR